MYRRCGLCHRLVDEFLHGENCPDCGGYAFLEVTDVGGDRE